MLLCALVTLTCGKLTHFAATLGTRRGIGAADNIIDNSSLSESLIDQYTISPFANFNEYPKFFSVYCHLVREG